MIDRSSREYAIQRAAVFQRTREKIKQHGWIVQGVFDNETFNPFLYTVGLTEAGLPELMLSMPGRQSEEWFRFGQRLLNKFGQQSTSKELEIGKSYPCGFGSLIIDVVEPVISNDGLWPGTAYEFYGHDTRLLELKPQGW